MVAASLDVNITLVWSSKKKKKNLFPFRVYSFCWEKNPDVELIQAWIWLIPFLHLIPTNLYSFVPLTSYVFQNGSVNPC
jgi:hypothetical protein